MRHVPEDEAQEVRELLSSNKIEFFETFAGNWGVSMPALWLKKNEQYKHARRLIEDYQQQRSLKMREEYEQEKKSGEAKTLWHSFTENPSRFILYMGLAIAILYFSLKFFLSF